MCEPSYVGVTWCYNEDRKSTRLNSSHGYISYAVFCLKKKKKNKILYAALNARRHPHFRWRGSLTPAYHVQTSDVDAVLKLQSSVSVTSDIAPLRATV